MNLIRKPVLLPYEDICDYKTLDGSKLPTISYEKPMKIAIHHRSDSYSTEWIKYCEKYNIDYKIVDCYDFDIIEQLKGCDAFLWNWAQWHSRDVLFARQLIYSIEQMGIEVYPNSKSCLLFDDKLGQKYLLEALDIPLEKSDVFFNKSEAINWIKNIKLPVVFKLRGGSSSVNVKLISTKSRARRLINIAFSRGFRPSDRLSDFKDRIHEFNKNKNIDSFIHMLKGVIRIIYPREHERILTREKGYVYFQKFLPNKTFDIRVFVFGDKAVAIKRIVRKNDFRASGSNDFLDDPNEISPEYIREAFRLNRILKMQSVAFDFIKDDKKIKLLEICYATGNSDWIGYFDQDAVFYPVKGFKIEHGIIADVINTIHDKISNQN